MKPFSFNNSFNLGAVIAFNWAFVFPPKQLPIGGATSSPSLETELAGEPGEEVVKESSSNLNNASSFCLAVSSFTTLCT